MKPDVIRKYKQERRTIFIFLVGLWVLSLIFAIIGYAVGTPWNDWLSSMFTETHAVIYFIVVAALGLGLAFLRNLYIWYVCVISLLWLLAFWKVPASLLPSFSSFVEIAVAVIFFSWLLLPSSKEQSES